MYDKTKTKTKPKTVLGSLSHFPTLLENIHFLSGLANQTPPLFPY